MKPKRGSNGAPVLAALSVAGLLLPLATRLLANTEGTLAWLLDLASHWQWLFLPGLIISAGQAAVRRRRWGLLLLAAPLPWLTASAQAPATSMDGPVLSVATANVHLGNGSAQRLGRWLSSEAIDIVAVLEVSHRFAADLATLPGYRFRRVEPRDDPFGLALLSRHPIEEVRVIRDRDGIAHIEALVRWQDRAVSVVVVHPMPPLSPAYHAARNRQLRALADSARTSELPTIIAGDLNATPWSSAFGGLSARGLRRANGLSPSWPAVLRGIVGIPIDHVLVTPDWSVVDEARGPGLDSDHLPRRVRLVLQSRPDGGTGTRPTTRSPDG